MNVDLNKEYVLRGKFEERVSSKSGRTYIAFVVKIGEYEKIVFFDSSEIALLKSIQK